MGLRQVIVLLAVVGAILAEAPLPYRYDPPQQQAHHHHHDQLNGFRPSHGYPCPDGIIHHNSEGRIMNQHFETSGEPILAQQLPLSVQSDKQVTVNSQIAFGEHSHSNGEFISAPSKGYIPPPPLPLPIQHQPANFHGSGSIVNGVGKATPPFALNQHIHHHHHNQQFPLPIQQHRPLPPIPQRPPPQPQYLPPRQNFIHHNNFAHNQAHHTTTTTQAINVPAPFIPDNLIPPPIGSTHGNFVEHNQFASGGSSGSFGGSINSGSLNTVSSTGSSFGSVNVAGGEFGGSSSSGSSFGSSGSFGSANVAEFGGAINSVSSGSSFGSSSGSLGFTSIGSTHNFNHPGLDEGLSQVISETFSNAGVGENVEKHIYVHVPPEDLEERGHNQHIQQQLPAAPPKKHYKIIFIKAPNQQPSTNVYTQIAQQQAAEEKTLVYVLVKKPDEPTIEDIQQIQSTYKPSKPEVYFIKYKTRKEEGGHHHHHDHVDNVDLTNGSFQGSDLSSVGGIDIRGGFNGETNTIQDALTTGIIEPRIPNEGHAVYGPPDHHQ